MPKTQRTPKLGDIVGIKGESGTWVVSGVSHQRMTVNLEKIGSQPDAPQRLATRWDLLIYRDQEDSSQNALRVVREATENN